MRRRAMVAGLIVEAALLGALAAGCGAGGAGASPTTSATPPRVAATATPAAGVPCEPRERLDYHAHAHLAIFIEGRPEAVPPSIGIGVACVHWLHTHDSSGVIHIEAPRQVSFTLGDFARIWGVDVGRASLLGRRVDAGHEIRVFVNGQPYDGDPASIPLGPHAVIVLELGPPFVDPPSFRFPPGL